MPVSAIINKHLEYTYDNGWTYEFWLKSPKRIVYSISGGPMAGRHNYQTCHIQEVRADEVFQISWLEETGTIVSLVLDIVQKRISTIIAFSKGHWENSHDAHGDKRNPKDFERWRELAKIGIQTDRYLIIEQATVDKIYEGRGNLEDIDENAPTV